VERGVFLSNSLKSWAKMGVSLILVAHSTFIRAQDTRQANRFWTPTMASTCCSEGYMSVYLPDYHALWLPVNGAAGSYSQWLRLNTIDSLDQTVSVAFENSPCQDCPDTPNNRFSSFIHLSTHGYMGRGARDTWTGLLAHISWPRVQ
jgi:hypothetical protein